MLALTAGIAVLGYVLGPDPAPTALLALGPLLTAMRASTSQTALVAACATLLALGLGFETDALGAAELTLETVAIAAVAVLATMIARLRVQRELGVRRLAAQHAVAETLVSARTLEDAAPQILQDLAETLGWDGGAAWLADDEDGAMRCLCVWIRPEVDAREFVDMTARIALDRGTGLPGRVWQSGEPSWIADVVEDPNFPRARAAAAGGLHAGFGFPILGPNGVLGVIELFSGRARKPDASLLRLTETLGAALAQFVQRRRAELAVRSSRDQLEAILGGVADGVFVRDRSGEMMYANAAAAATLGYATPEQLVAASVADTVARAQILDESGEPMPVERLPGSRALAGEEAPQATIRLRRSRTGEERWTLCKASGIRDERGEVLMAIVILEDITEQKRAEQAQRHIAATLQRSLLPPSLPDIAGFELAARFRAQGRDNEVGGDFYDVFETGDGRWAIVVGDVSGKGPDAAATTALARYTLRTAAMQEGSPSAILRVLNEGLLREGGSDNCCTAVVALLSVGVSGARVDLGVGGHPLPLRLCGEQAREVGSGGTLLGAFEDPDLKDESVELEPGDALVLYTDGVLDAYAPRRPFASSEVRTTIEARAGLTADAIAEGVESTVLALADGEPRDDIAIVALRAIDGEPPRSTVARTQAPAGAQS